MSALRPIRTMQPMLQFMLRPKRVLQVERRQRIRMILLILLCGVWSVGLVPRAGGQTPRTGALPGPTDTLPVVITNFTEPPRPENPAFSQTVGGCQSLFQRTLTRESYDHPRDLTPAHDTLLSRELLWRPLAPPAIAAGRQCWHRVYRASREIADVDIQTAWRLALVLNEDTIAQALITRWLSVEKTPRAQAAFLDTVVGRLVAVQAEGVAYVSLTDAHVAMARQYLAQLEALGPAYIRTWLKVQDVFKASGAERLDSDASLQRAIDDAQHIIAVIDAVPSGLLSSADQNALAETKFSEQVYGVARLTYMKTLAHTDLTHFEHLVDSSVPAIGRRQLIGTPPPLITADTWFGTPGNAPPARVPAPQTVSLLVFMSPTPGQPATKDLEKDALLRRLHTLIPNLPIILMAVTNGVWANESVREHPEREAQLMYQYVHDSLQVPGIMGVLYGKHEVATTDGRVLPVELPLLDQYKIDAGEVYGQMFVVDQDGWVVDQGRSLRALVPRLWAKATHQTTYHGLPE